MDTLQSLLERKKTLILDGGFATELEKYGADLNHELWSARVLIEQPELVKGVHRSYLEAGADLILSGTYQASAKGFMRYGMSLEAARQLLRKGVGLAVEARNTFVEDAAPKNHPLVGASVGPYGAYLADGSEYTGTYAISREDLYRFHQERLSLFLAAGPDFIAFETTPNIMEANVYVDLLEEFPDFPAILSFSCGSADSLVSGESLEAAISRANKAANIAAIGVNCCAPELAGQVLQTLAKLTDKPLLAYPNRGESWDSHNKCWIDSGKEVNLSDSVRSWIRKGVAIVGGCCRTDPEYIRKLAEQLN